MTLIPRPARIALHLDTTFPPATPFQPFDTSTRAWKEGAVIVGFGVKDIAKCCSGLWQYLIARVNGRTKVELERERNRGTTDAIKALPPGAELLENEQDGRLRVIRMPYPPPVPPLPQPTTWSRGELTE